MYAIDILVAEHENVRRLNKIMRNACILALEKGTVEPDDFRQFIFIIREYADKHHHGKEELFLFKEMEENLDTAAKKLIRHGMLVEHDLGRLYVQQLEEATNSYETDASSENLLDIITNSMSYADLLERHITKENSVVYTFAENTLEKEILLSLDEKTRIYEEKDESIKLIAKISDMLETLDKKYKKQ